MIRAKVWSDDHEHVAAFDATPWFEQATGDQIEALAACGWTRDYPADDVALFFDRTHPHVTKVLDYIYDVNTADGDAGDMGFECAVHPRDAREWLLMHRPGVLLALSFDEEKSFESWDEED